MSEIAILCPTRRGAPTFAKMARTMIATEKGGRARVYAYVDDDQADQFRRELSQEFPLGVPPEIIVHWGPRLGPVGSANELARRALPGTRVFGMVPDDAEFRTPGWDLWLSCAVDDLPRRIGVVSAAHNYGAYVNFPFVSNEWLHLVGWYFNPNAFHFCCDTILELLGEATTIRYATPDEMFMFHHGTPTLNPNDYSKDANTFLAWVVGERRELVKKLKAAQS